MVIEIIMETTCKCGCSIRVIATKYRCLNQDWTPHSCKFKDEEVLRGILDGYGFYEYQDTVIADKDFVISKILNHFQLKGEE